MKKILMGLIRLYRKYISPLTPPSCRYYPTCSGYALEAIQVHGAFKGSLMAIVRILKCNPLFPGGYDPVPPKKQRKKRKNANEGNEPCCEHGDCHCEDVTDSKKS